jgi:glucokinase
MKVLAGDIGGTKTILAIAELQDGRVRILEEKRYPSGDYSDFTTLAREFLSSIRDGASRACFGVAGPVVKGKSPVTKLPWTLVEHELQKDLGLERVEIINDFVAVAQSTEVLGSEDLEVLNPGEPDPDGPVAVLGAGTGLGEAIMVKAGKHRVVIPSEGGHADFGPRDELEIDFLRWMLGKYERVSYDRVLSGPGLADIYAFLRDTEQEKEPEELRQAIETEGDPAPAINRFATEKGDPLAQATLDFFCSIYGSEAGNLALKAVSKGGVYVGGGIAPRILSHLKKGGFRRSFVTKGRLSPVVEAIPVFVITNPKAGLLGAVVAASRL